MTPSDSVRRYAGIGSRETPPIVLGLMGLAAERLAREGWVLRSGGAAGADSAFALGAGDRSEVFLHTGSIAPWAFELAEQLHPAWDRCGSVARRLHARNSQILLGAAGDSPVSFVLCWTPGGRGGGGTGQGIRIAESRGIPVFDLAHDAVLRRITSFVSRPQEVA